MWDGIQIAAQQLPDDVSSAAAFTTIVRAAEHLARAQHLLALQSGKDDEALRQNVETEIGIVYQGDRGRIIPQNGSGTLVEHDRIYIRLTNRGTSTVYVTVFGINKAGIIGLLSGDDATGIKLEPDQSYTLGGGGEFEALKGMGVTWPEGVPSSQPVDEQIVLILTDPAVDLRHLANRDRCQKGRRGPQSNLEQLANCITYGGTRTIKPEPRATPIRYDVLQVPYSLLPFTQQDPGPNADYAIREWSREEPMAANEIPEPEADASWRALPSQPSVVPRASKGGIGALVRAAKGIPPCVWVVNQHSEEITVVVSKYRPNRLVSGGGISASSTGAGVNISTMTFLSPVTKKKLAPSALGPTRSKAVFPLWTRKEGFGVISILKGPSESLYIENDRIPIGATAYFKNLPDLELRDYYGQQLN
ncbi:hypothetical protein BO86DRAFT_376995 [Aspergillus japonicus CBS 114.51]|uniref:Uncharacterized protein n=1 Tax=Aspergillus japonicus CBS 114.51 TaxID=1448312 RepID=A0A8T8XBP5_ASPJA|nr:hypothetical protein BO86DRAFT_376995 [Aspergillus japonicus CBS 114.51]RAH84819.1 hypothetical protein BO86DRAFT_376995 [Aspergillus japonicus CBS 114.51]